MKAAKNEKFDEECKFVIDFYKDDFDAAKLRMQLDILSANFPTNQFVIFMMCCLT